VPDESSNPNPAQTPQLQLELLNLVRKNWWLIGAGMVSAIGGAAFYSMGQTKIYQANTTVQMEPIAPKPLGGEVHSVVEVGAGNFWNTQEYYQTQYEILKSRSIAKQTVSRLALHRDATFVLNKAKDFMPPEGFVPNEDMARSAVQGRLEVEPIKDSRLVRVTFKDAEPERAKRVLATLVEIYIDENVDSVLESTNTAAEWLDVQLAKLKEELGERELALHDFKKDNQILSVSMDDQNNMLRDEMQQLNHELTRVRTAIEEIRSRYDLLAKIDAADPIKLPIQELLDSTVLQRLRQDYIDAKKEHAALLELGKGEKHPSALAAASHVELSKEALLAEVSNIKQALENRLRSKKMEAAGLSGLFARAKAQALELNRMGLDYHRLERAKNNTEKVFSLVLERSKESDITRFMRFNNIRVVDEAIVGGAPVEPRTVLNLGIGGFLGLGLGLLAALGRNLMDRTFRSGHEVEELLKLPLLGTLPKTASMGKSARRKRSVSGLEGNELIVNDKPNSTAAEAARALRTNLMFTSLDKKQRTLLVTSGGPADGKTTVACFVACAFAQANKRVLLLDCDLRRPKLHKVFGRTNEAGLSTLLMDEGALEGWDLSTRVPNLDLLTSGPSTPNPAEFLQSEKFDRLLQRLTERYDQLVIDSPPVAAVTDATILSTKVDGSILVVRAHSTSRELARQGARTLQDVTSTLRGVVLNDLDASRSGYGYGGYYKYQYYYQKNDDAA
jgi:capsular exopolysaccharide synthesis family protein